MCPRPAPTRAPPAATSRSIARERWTLCAASAKRSTRSAPYRARGWRARWTGLRAIATAVSSRRPLISATRCWRRPDPPMDALPLDFENVPAAPERNDAQELSLESWEGPPDLLLARALAQHVDHIGRHTCRQRAGNYM